jgi:regulatory protein
MVTKTSSKPKASCRGYALKLLAQSDASSSQLQQRLLRRGYDDGEVAEALEYLASAGFLDDRKFAERFMGRVILRADAGPLWIRQELRERGLSRELIEKALEDYRERVDQDAVALALAQAQAREPVDEKERARLSRLLYRRGFTQGAIIHALRSLLDNNPGKS